MPLAEVDGRIVPVAINLAPLADPLADTIVLPKCKECRKPFEGEGKFCSTLCGRVNEDRERNRSFGPVHHCGSANCDFCNGRGFSQ